MLSTVSQKVVTLAKTFMFGVFACASLLPQAATFSEEFLQHLPALVLEHPTDDFGLVVQPRVFEDAVERSGRAPLRVRRAEDHAGDAREHQCPGTHRARLERGVESRSREPIVAKAPGRAAQHDNFGVRRWVTPANRTVVSARDHLAVRSDENSTDGNLAGAGAAGSLAQSQAHEVLVRLGHTVLRRKQQGAAAILAAAPLSWCALQDSNLRPTDS